LRGSGGLTSKSIRDPQFGMSAMAGAFTLEMVLLTVT
jgi:hypothetical protein